MGVFYEVEEADDVQFCCATSAAIGSMKYVVAAEDCLSGLLNHAIGR